MSNKDGALVGFAALEQDLQLGPVQPLTSTNRIGPTPGNAVAGGFRVTTKTVSYRPENSMRGHFEFGLKYDDLNLEWLSRFFKATGPSWLEEWVKETPRSVYARKAGFLYEWLTGQQLGSVASAVKYEEILDPARYLTATTPERNQRWKILDNMPGTPDFCPMIRLTDELQADTAFDVIQALEELDNKFGADLLFRSAAWLTFNESRATFTMEKEADRANDIKRFAVAMAERCGRMDAPLSDEGLVVLQRDILGTRVLRTGIRRSPVFVGSGANFDVTVVHYIAPNFQDLPRLMEGLRAFELRTRPKAVDQRRTLLRTAAISYGFVYLHPLSDGNGRVHRLLFNDVLMRDGLVPNGVILPVSSTILKSSTLKGEYDKVLDLISLRQVKKYVTDYSFGEERVYEDGVVSDFYFDGAEDAAPMWQYPDLTQHAGFFARVVTKTIKENMTDEAELLARHDQAKTRLKRVFEMPDGDADRIIRSLRENKGKVTNVLAKQYAVIFEDPEIAAETLEAVMSALDGRGEEKVTPRRFDADR